MADIITYNGSWLGYSGAIITTPPDPNPLGLPQYTIRARFPSAPAATADGGFSGAITHVSDDIYDIQTSNWDFLFGGHYDGYNQQIDPKPIEILGANSTGITSMIYMFCDCSITSIPFMDTSSVTRMRRMFYNNRSLTLVPLFDTSNVTDFESMFEGCNALKSAPAFDMSSAVSLAGMFRYSGLTTAPALSTDSVTYLSSMFEHCTSLTSVPQYTMTSAYSTLEMFRDCINVSSGALSLYNSVSQQATPPTNHARMFLNCGTNTVSGLVELKQIPGDWGGQYGEITCEKYRYSNADTALAAYTPRGTNGYLTGAIWVPVNNGSYVSSPIYSIKTPSTAGEMRVYPKSNFYKWDTSTTQSISSSVKFGAFAIPKANLSRQTVYGFNFGWKSSSEPQFLCEIESVGSTPSSGYRTYTPPVNATAVIGSKSVPADWAILLCLYIYTNSTYYFGTVAQPTYGYLPYTSDGDLIVQVGDPTPLTMQE